MAPVITTGVPTIDMMKTIDTMKMEMAMAAASAAAERTTPPTSISLVGAMPLMIGVVVATLLTC